MFDLSLTSYFPVIKPIADVVVSPVLTITEQTVPLMELVGKFPTVSVFVFAAGCLAFSGISKVLKRTIPSEKKLPPRPPKHFIITDVNQAKRMLKHHRGDVLMNKLPNGYDKEEFVFTCSEKKTCLFRRAFKRIFSAAKEQLASRAHQLVNSYMKGEIKFEDYSTQGVLRLLEDERSFHAQLQEQGLSSREAELTIRASIEPAKGIYSVLREAIKYLSSNKLQANEIRAEIQGFVDAGHELHQAIQLSRKLRDVCMEALRLSQPIRIPRKGYSAANEIVDGQKIYPQDDITINNMNFAHDPNVVGPCPSEFRPDRWVGASDNWANLPFLPFGANRHRCPGWELAVAQILQLVGSVVYAS